MRNISDMIERSFTNLADVSLIAHGAIKNSAKILRLIRGGNMSVPDREYISIIVPVKRKKIHSLDQVNKGR